SISLPYRGAFHLSLTVLVHSRLLGVFSLGRWSSRIPTEFLVFRRTQDTLRREYFVEYRAVTFYGGSFQIASSKIFLCNSKGVSYNPKEQALWFGLVPFRSPLLRKSHLLSLPPGNKMFQFPGSASFTLCIQINVLLHYEQWVPPFGNPCIRLLTTPQGLSELVPSFFGS